MTHDAHFIERGMILKEVYDGEEMVFVGPPVKLSDTPAKVNLTPPKLGEHTEELLQSVGFSEEEIDAMRNMNLI